MKHFGIRKALSGLLAGVIMLSSIPFSAAAEEEFSITISVEGNTLGQGMYIEPVTYTLDEINSLIATEGYDPCTEETLTAGLVTLAMFVDKNLEYEMTGTWDSTAYVSSIKGLDKGYLNIPAIITENGGPSNDENDGNDDENLGEFDYSSMAGWMLCVDNHFIQVGCASYNAAEAQAEGASFKSGSVIRWQFTLYGYGADIGSAFMGGPAYFEAANKDALYRKYAELSAKGFFDTNAQAKTDALAVMENLTATQEEADSALKALNAASKPVVEPTEDRDIFEELRNTLEHLAETYPEPKFGTSGGEWTVLTLARGGYYQPDNKYFSDYYKRIVETVNSKAETVGMNGALDVNKSTENSRLIMALSSIGRDAHKVGNYDLIEAYSINGFDWIKKQGINGPVFALIALDTRAYETTDTTLRQQCIDYILEKQVSGGGWAYFGSTADPDMTSMTLQALAPYTSDENVKDACDKAFTALSNAQQDDGGYKSWGSANCESVAQVVVACTAHGINPHTDSRFVKNGNSLVDALMSFYNADVKMFSHVAGDGGNAMATDQAAYALVSYDRFKSGKTSLYNMTDVPAQEEEEITLSAPTNVKATAGDKQVTITWNAVENAAKYLVQRLENDNWNTVSTTEALSFTDTGLTNGISYSYKVIAVNGDVQSEASEAVNAIPEAPVPAAPTNVKATAGNKQVTITWNAVENAAKYLVQRLENDNWNTVSTTEALSFTDTGLTNGISYSYKVIAVNGDVQSEASEAVNAIPEAPVPAAPTNVKATAGDKQVTVTWNAVENATQYRVQRLNGNTWGTVATPKTNGFTNTGLTNGTSYSYRVLAYVDGKWSGASAVVTAAPKGSIIPQNVKATAGDKQVKLTWTAVSGATQYRVQRLNGNTWGTVATPKTNSFTNTGLTNGTSYSYRVLAYVDGKWSGASAVVTAKPAK